MPTKRTRFSRNNISSLTTAELSHLRWGSDYFGSSLKTDDDMKTAWKLHRAQVEERAACDIPERAKWPIYAYLRFEKKMSHEAALKAIHQTERK
jgi:hypothetical protein